ncbi:MAG TPA: hypothetical protein VGG64_20470 [Pirellulales bacterium]
MSAKRRPQHNSKTGRAHGPAPAPSRSARPTLSVRRTGNPGEYELIHPHCAEQRAEDLEEVHQMIDGGELDIAVDELRWLLNGCPECLEAHKLLGELALSEGDTRLARAHFGYAFDLGMQAVPVEGLRGTLPFSLPANRGFLTAAKGLALCLYELHERDRAREVAERLIAADPTDPLRARDWLSQWPSEDGERPAQDGAAS